MIDHLDSLLDTGSSTPFLMYGGVVALGLGLLIGLLALVPRRGTTGASSQIDRISAYTDATSRHREAPVIGTTVGRKGSDQALTGVAKDAAGLLLANNKSLEARIASRLEGAGSNLKPAEWLLVHTGVVVLATLIGLGFSRGSILVGTVFLVIGAGAPWFWLSWRRTRRHKKFNEALPQTLQLVSGSLSAGLSLQQSLDTVVREGGEPMAEAFRRAMVETRLGVSLEDALEGIAARFSSDDFRWVVMAIRIQRQVGGNLAELFTTVATTMREREYVRRQVLSLSSEGKMSAWVIGAIPPLFFVYLLLARRDYLMPFLHDPRGVVIMIGGAFWMAVGVFWMSKMVKVEV